MTVTEEAPARDDTDPHGDFKYTLRQYLLMRRNNHGGDWTDVLADVNAEQRAHPEWDTEAKDTYMNWQHRYATGSLLDQ